MPRTQASLRRFALLAAILTTLFAVPGAIDSFGLPKLFVLLVFVSALALLAAPEAAALLRTRPQAAMVLGLFMLGFTVAALLSRQAAYLTLYGAIGRANGWLCYISLALIMLVGATAFDSRRVRMIITALAWLGPLMALYGFLQYRGIDPIDWHRGFVIKGTFGNPDFASGFLGITAVVLLGLALRATAPQRLRLLALVAMLWVLWVIKLSLALQGLMGFAVGALVLVGLLLLGADRAGWVRRLRWPYAISSGLFLVLSALAMADRGPLAPLLFKASVQHRWYMWEAALRMFQLRPVTGVGIEAYNDWYRTTRSAASVAFLGPDVFSNAAHSVPLNLLATGGLVVALPYLAVLVFVLRCGIIAARNRETRMLSATLTGAWAAYVADSAVSMDQIGIAVWGWLLGGAVVALLPAAQVAVPSVSLRRASMIAAVVAAALGFGSVAYAAHIDAQLSAASRLPTATAAQRAIAVPALLRAAAESPEPIRVLGVLEELHHISANAASIAAGVDAVHRFPREVLLWRRLALDYEYARMWQAAIAVREHIATLDPLDAKSLRRLARDRAAGS